VQARAESGTAAERAVAARRRRACAALSLAIDETLLLGADARAAIARLSQRGDQMEAFRGGDLISALAFSGVWLLARRDARRANECLAAFRDALGRLGPPPGAKLAIELPIDLAGLSRLANGMSSGLALRRRQDGSRVRARAAAIRVQSALGRLEEARAALAPCRLSAGRPR
jgi:hypothetical protein